MSAPPQPRTWLDEALVRGRVFLFGALTRPVDIAVLATRPRALWAYLRLWLARYRSSPYRPATDYESLHAVRAAGQSRGSVEYGETPVFVVLGLFRPHGLGPGARFLDPCAGRGRVVLGARATGATSTGIELRPPHVAHGRAIVAGLGATLRAGDGSQGDEWLTATHVYVCWTGLPDEARAKFDARCADLPAGAVVATLTHPARSHALDPLAQRTIVTSWGPETAYLYRRR